MEYLKPIGLLLFFVSMVSLVYRLLPRGAEVAGRGTATEGEDAGFIHLFRPAFGLFLPLTRLLPLDGLRKRIEQAALRAGIAGAFTPDEFFAFQLFCMVLFFFLTAGVFAGMVIPFLAALVGLAYPYIWLQEKKKTRQAAILSSMPDMVDMLSLSVEAGLDFTAAVRKVCDAYGGDNDPLVYELDLMGKNMRVGMTREEALKNLADRVDLQEVYAFVSILVQADRMGTGIADILKVQAAKMRQERFMRAERTGAIVSQKLMIPVVLLIFPIIFIVVLGPVILKYIYGN